jgi:hypothetical protein
MGSLGPSTGDSSSDVHVLVTGFGVRMSYSCVGIYPRLIMPSAIPWPFRKPLLVDCLLSPSDYCIVNSQYTYPYSPESHRSRLQNCPRHSPWPEFSSGIFEAEL